MILEEGVKADSEQSNKGVKSKRGLVYWLAGGALIAAGLGLAGFGAKTHMSADEERENRPDYNRRVELESAWIKCKNTYEATKNPEINLIARERLLAHELKGKSQTYMGSYKQREIYKRMAEEYDSICTKLRIDPDLTERGDDVGLLLAMLGIAGVVGGAAVIAKRK